MKSISFKAILADVRFWLILFFLIRLIGIINPPLEFGHNWRQSLTNMIARNFLEYNANIFYPMIDMAGEKTGIIGAEFPFFNYLIFLASSIFDSSHWAGRLINLIVSSIGIYFFYMLIRKIFNKETAFASALILTTSIWFGFSRKIMPDTFSVALVIIGIYYAYCYLKEGKNSKLLLFFIFCTLGMLCKIPALSLFAVISIALFFQTISVNRKIAFFIVAGVSFAIVCAWYFYWVPHLVKTYEFQLYFPKGILEGASEIAHYIPGFFEKFYFSALHSYIAFGCSLIGGYFFVKRESKWALFGVGIIVFVFFVFILKTGAVFPKHSYYIIPFVPVLALFAGYFLQTLPLKFQYILLGVIMVESIGNQQHDFFVQDSQRYKTELENLTQKHIPKNDLIIINGGNSPQDIYFAHRKGWTVENSKIKDTSILDSLTALGARFLVLDKTKLHTTIQLPSIIYSGTHYSIHKLERVNKN